ncbi:MAG: thioesterase [Actinobacteria bacterium]|nr:MAG: thioesterase [Actinomycetota bacterium]
MSKKELSPESTASAYQNAVGLTWPGTLMERMGMEVLEHSAERTVVAMPVEGNTQRIGILHGGATAALAETAGSLAASASLTDDTTIVVGVELSISHIRSVSTGTVTATATAEHLGRTSTVHHIVIEDADGKLISTARASNRLLPKKQ